MLTCDKSVQNYVFEQHAQCSVESWPSPGTRLLLARSRIKWAAFGKDLSDPSHCDTLLDSACLLALLGPSLPSYE